MRNKIPLSIVEELLFKSDHSCSICGQSGKDVQLHHIDGDNSNNVIDNLIVLCLDCHSKVTGTAGLGRVYTPGEVKRYKRSWEKTVAQRRGISRPVVRHRKEVVSQVDIMFCEILASKSPERAKELLDALYELHVYRGSTELDASIVEGLQHLALMAGLNSAILSAFVAEKLWDMCYHFVGPKEVPMNKVDKKHVLSCVSALGTLGDFSSGYIRQKKATEAFCSSIWNFLEIAVWYDWQDLAQQITSAVQETRTSCWHAGKLEYPIGDEIILVTLRRMINYIREEKPNWNKAISSLESILQFAG
jgi:hypothetical protein